jgi:hypothetical protein
MTAPDWKFFSIDPELPNPFAWRAEHGERFVARFARWHRSVVRWFVRTQAQSDLLRRRGSAAMR